jgi:hypothetical protein
MASSDETKLTSTLLNGEKKSVTWETYVWIHTEQHTGLNGIKSMATLELITVPRSDI